MPEQNPEMTMTPEELTEKYSQEIADYCGVEVEPGVKVVVFDSMAEMGVAFKELTGIEPPVYLKGFSPDIKDKWREVWIVKWGAPNEYGQIISREYFNKSLKHEIAHTYQKVFCRENEVDSKSIPIWMKEGMAYALAGQKANDPGEITEDRLRNLGGLDKAKYGIGNKIVSEILKDYGKEKLFALMSLQNQDLLYTELKRMFDWIK